MQSLENRPLRNEYDVVVIGAGLAGLECARLLGLSGLHVLLADCKSDLSESVHTTGIFVRRTLEDFDLPQDCLGPAVRHVTLYSPKRRTLELESPHAEFRVGKMGQIYERYLQYCHETRVDCLPCTRYSGLNRVNGDLVVQLVTDGVARNVKTRFIVGADGANSRVARDLNLDVNRDWIVGVECVFTNVPLDGPPRLHCFLDPQLSPGYLAWIANDGEETHIGVGGYPLKFDPAEALESFLSSIGGIIDLSRARLVERRGGRIPIGGVLPRIANEYGLLVGDAAGAVSPFTAGGLDPCLRLSNHAAKIIAVYLQSGDKRVLESYSGELFRSHFSSRLWMRRLVSIFDQRILIEFCCAALRLTPLKWFARHVFFGRGSFPDTHGPTTEELPLKVREAL